MDVMSALGGWELEALAKEALEQVGITNSNMPVDKMSGGQRRKVTVAAALLGAPDILILDEPTNHMDVQVRAKRRYPCNVARWEFQTTSECRRGGDPTARRSVLRAVHRVDEPHDPGAGDDNPARDARPRLHGAHVHALARARRRHWLPVRDWRRGQLQALPAAAPGAPRRAGVGGAGRTRAPPPRPRPKRACEPLGPPVSGGNQRVCR